MSSKIPKSCGEGEETVGSCRAVQPDLQERRYKPSHIE